jgi:ABC-type transporter Mla MlaB component
MWRIQKDFDGCITTLRLSGQIQADHIPSICSEIDNAGARKILDLRDVTLVDIGVVRFLRDCEDKGIELVQCPRYVREWILRERC